MKTKMKNEKNIYKKGELIENNLGWAGIVMQATRGNDPTIIPMVEMFGYEHECGSIYTDDREHFLGGSVYVVRRISKAVFEAIIQERGYKVGEYYFKGQLIG